MKIYLVPLNKWESCMEWEMTSNANNVLHTDMWRKLRKKENKFAVSLRDFEGYLTKVQSYTHNILQKLSCT